MANYDVTYDAIDAVNATRQHPYVVTAGDVQVSTTPAIGYTAALSGGKIHLTFNRPVLDSIELRLPASYTIGLPVGAAAITITHVETVLSTGSCTDVWLTFIGDLKNAATYTVTLEAGAARDFDPLLNGLNLAVAMPFTGVNSIALNIVSITPTSATTLRVKFSKAVRQVSASNTDDALRSANYVITDHLAAPLTVSSVVTTSTTDVVLTTATQVQGEAYSIAINNICDIAGNVVT